MAFCSQCGNEINKSGKFCGNCGNPIKTINDVKKSNNLKFKQIILCKKNRKRNILIFCIIIFLGVIFGKFVLAKNKGLNISSKKQYTLRYTVKKDGKIGVIDKNGKVIIEPKYEELGINNIDEKTTWLKVKVDGKYGFMDLKENWIIKPNYEQCGYFCEGLASVAIDGKAGFINLNGQVSIKPKFDALQESQYYWFDEDGISIVKKDGKYGAINKKGEFLIEPKYDSMSRFSEGLAIFKEGDKEGYIDKNGKIIVDAKYKYASLFKDGIAVVTQNDKESFIDKNGKIIIDKNFHIYDNFENGTAYIYYYDSENNMFINKIINKKGETVLDSNSTYGIAGNIKEGLIKVTSKKNSKYGFIDTSGKEIVEAKYDHVYDFMNGFAVVEKDEASGRKRYGAIDKNGKEVIPCQYDYVDNFYDNNAARVYICDDLNDENLFSKHKDDFDYIYRNSKVGYIDKTGKCIWEPTK